MKSIFSSIDFANECEWFNNATFKTMEEMEMVSNCNMCMNHKKVKKKTVSFFESREIFTRKKEKILKTWGKDYVTLIQKFLFRRGNYILIKN